MKILAALLAAIQLLLLPTMAAAQSYAGARSVTTETWVEEWDPASQRWVRIAEDVVEPSSIPDMAVVTTHYINGVLVEQTQTHGRHATPVSRPRAYSAQPDAAIAQYGPFQVLDGKRAAMVGATDQMSPRWFDAMLRDHPALEVLEMIEAPGTSHDVANLAVGRRIRDAGLRTHVPRGGSVRSGAVELFLAGTKKTMEEGAQFAVHSWRDNYGREPQDFPADHAANRLYLDYYVEMGMTEEQARAFYAMTNSVPHASAKWLGAAEMRGWVRSREKALPAVRVIEDEPVMALLETPVTIPLLDAPYLPSAIKVTQPRLAYADLNGSTLAQIDVARLESLDS